MKFNVGSSRFKGNAVQKFLNQTLEGWHYYRNNDKKPD
jgi:hypothetical protein